MLTFLYCKQINALLTLKTNYDNELEKKYEDLIQILLFTEKTPFKHNKLKI